MKFSPLCSLLVFAFPPRGSHFFSPLVLHASKSGRKVTHQRKNIVNFTEQLKPPFLFWKVNSPAGVHLGEFSCMGLVFHTHESCALTLKIYKNYFQRNKTYFSISKLPLRQELPLSGLSAMVSGVPALVRNWQAARDNLCSIATMPVFP